MIRWTPKSIDDLEKIRDHIAKNFNVDLAIEKTTSLIEKTEALLSKNPLAGKIIETNPLFSQIIIDENSVFYCENPRDKNLYIVYVKARGTLTKKSRIKL
jgi:plasmid stabilization system protein ParE